MSKRIDNLLHRDAYRLIMYKGTDGKKQLKEVIWNNRDGPAPAIIYAKNSDHQIIRDRFYKEPVRKQHALKDGELYFTNTTKRRAKFLAKKVINGRWNNTRYPLYSVYTNRKEGKLSIYKSFYGDGNCFTILKHGRNITTYMSKQFRNFISQT